jgi:hypothetical protein
MSMSAAVMKKSLGHIRKVSLLLLLLSVVACGRCKEEVNYGNPAYKLRLLSQHNQDLWFGSTAIFDPDSIYFMHKTRGLLTHTVNKKARVVELIFPPTAEARQEITLVLNSSDTDKIHYSTQFLQEECSQGEELLYVDFENIRMCNRCGDGRFNSSTTITLRKNL